MAVFRVMAVDSKEWLHQMWCLLPRFQIVVGHPWCEAIEDPLRASVYETFAQINGWGSTIQEVIDGSIDNSIDDSIEEFKTSKGGKAAVEQRKKIEGDLKQIKTDLEGLAAKVKPDNVEIAEKVRGKKCD